jgi:hypothetical protein
MRTSPKATATGRNVARVRVLAQRAVFRTHPATSNCPKHALHRLPGCPETIVSRRHRRTIGPPVLAGPVPKETRVRKSVSVNLECQSFVLRFRRRAAVGSKLAGEARPLGFEKLS